MKPSSLLLALSLASNAILIAAFLLAPAPPKSSSAHSTLPNKTTSKTETRYTPKDADGLWTRLATKDPALLSARLRAAGFPSKFVRLIVLDLQSQEWDAARISILGRREDVPYWKNPSYMTENPEQREKFYKLIQEQSKAYRRLSSDKDALLEDDMLAANARRRYGDFSVEKLQRLSEIESDYSEMEQEVYHQLAIGKAKDLTAADREKLKLLAAEQRRDIQQALTPEEFEQYQLRASPTATRLRSQLELFRPTEAEYLALFSLQRSADEQLQNVDDGDRDVYIQSREKLKPQIEAALGPDRYADYVQATEHGSDKLNRLMVRLDLPLSTAGKISEVRQDITQRAETIRNDPQLDPAARSAQLASLAQEARTKLTTTLGGDRGYQAYDDMKGDWIRALQPKVPATKL